MAGHSEHLGGPGPPAKTALGLMQVREVQIYAYTFIYVASYKTYFPTIDSILSMGEQPSYSYHFCSTDPQFLRAVVN